jgi:alcohol dehydrogenase (cytochrome c)
MAMHRTLLLVVGAELLLACAAAQTVDNGRLLYEARCVGCHGADGTGGGHGPGIVDLLHSRVSSQQSVRDLILQGIPDKGMPAFKIPPGEADIIAAYVMRLKHPPGEASAGRSRSSDAAAGERYFFGQGNCAACHMIGGRGALFGPDLSAIGRDRRPEQLEKTLRSSPAYRLVALKLRDGRTIRGLSKNETPFDLQVLGEDRQWHLLLKDQVAEITREALPRRKAPEEEVAGLVAYLSGLVASPTAKIADDLRPEESFGRVARPAPGEWPTYNGNLSGNRFSPLNQIHAGNVEHLAPQWMFTLPGSTRALEVTPVVADGVMYVTAVNEVYALDARSGREIWHYSRPRSQGLAGDAASGINRGVAVLGDRIFTVSDNAHLFALHRLTGQLLWDVVMADSRQNYGSTSAPLVVNDLVIAGVSGGDEGVRGFLDAYRASTGEHVWRFWTIPAPGEPGSETWKGRAIEHGCGTTWLTGSYDPDANLLYWPTGNPCPDYNGDERVGDNLYTSSVLALDPATGKLKWYYQFTPHDLHDWDATETLVLVDAPFHGQPRKLLLQPNRNGFFYVLDRLSGRVLLAEPFVKRLTWASGIGPDGRPKLLPDNDPTIEGRLSCPSVAGAANWPSSAYYPATGLLYMFAEESCNIYTKNNEWWEAGKSFYGGGTRRPPPGSDGGKYMKAIDIQTGKTAWEIADVGGGILGSGLMATGGGLIFYGDGGGAFIAADARSGKLLWHFNTGQTWKAGPMTYLVDNKQYVGIAAGNTILAFALH